jgi:two-component sensor histidine kinase
VGLQSPGASASGRARRRRSGAVPAGFEFIEDVSEAIYGLAPDWTLTVMNGNAERFFGVRREETIGHSVWEVFPGLAGTKFQTSLLKLMQTRQRGSLQGVCPRTGRTIDARAFPLSDGGLGVAWDDVTALRSHEEELQEALRIQDLLYRELTHRVTNHFQQVASRLTLKAREIEDEAIRESFTGIAASVQCMALVNRRLYSRPRSIDRQDLGEYVEGLAEDLRDGLLPSSIRLETMAERGVRVGADAASMVGMIVAELVMNAAKHGWSEGQEGHIAITLARTAGEVALDVRDDGRGLPDGAAGRGQAGLGRRLFERQVESLNGRFGAENLRGGGVAFRLRFPYPGLQT